MAADMSSGALSAGDEGSAPAGVVDAFGGDAAEDAGEEAGACICLLSCTDLLLMCLIAR